MFLLGSKSGRLSHTRLGCSKETRSSGCFLLALVLLIVSSFAAPAVATQAGQVFAMQVSETSYRHYLDDVLYTHEGDDRGRYGVEHDLARENIVATFEDLGWEVELHAFQRGGQTYYNVIATKTGTVYPDSYYAVGAHYDSAGNPGADDDASGVAGLLELARVFSTCETAYSMRLMAFDLEEWGLIGSDAYVDDHLDEDFVAMLQLDMIAWNAGEYACNVDGSSSDSVLAGPLVAALEMYASALTVTTNSLGAWSDHKPFSDAGFVACVLSEADYEDNPCYHEVCDSIDTEDFIDYAMATDIVRGVAGYLADAACASIPIDCATGEGSEVGELGTEDCNANGLWDGAEIYCGFSEDLNLNGIPDECESCQTLYVDVAHCPSEGTGTEVDPFCCIRDAIDAADDGSNEVVQIIVADGTYTGAGNRSLSFAGKRLTLRSQNGPGNCVIDCEQASRAFALASGETRASIIEGFTITNGYSSYAGGAVFVVQSDGVLRNCRFINNHSEEGGGATQVSHAGSLLITGCAFVGNTTNAGGGAASAYFLSSSTIEDCLFVDNVASFGGAVRTSMSGVDIVRCRFEGNAALTGGGGAVYFQSTTTIQDCLIANNSCSGLGGGIWGHCQYGVTINNCTLTGNTATSAGGGVHLFNANNDTISNCIHWGNTPSDMSITGDLNFTYSNIEGGWEGEGNIDADPLFVDPDGPDDDPATWEDNDYRLAAGSPCIDAGSNFEVRLDRRDLDCDGDRTELIPFDLADFARFIDDPMTPDTGLAAPPAHLAIVDIGAYEFQALPNDCNDNGIPDDEDIASGFSEDCDSNGIPDECELCGDLNDDGSVDYDDYVIFLAAFGGVVDGVPPEDACCDADDSGDIGMADFAAWLACYRDFIGDPLADAPTDPTDEGFSRRKPGEALKDRKADRLERGAAGVSEVQVSRPPSIGMPG